MAGIGALYPIFAPWKTADQENEPNDRLPEYENGIVMGEFISSNMSLSYAEGQLYGDNALQIDVKDFTSAAIALESTYISMEAESVLFGSSYDPAEKKLIDSTEDQPPMGGFGFVRNVRHGNVEEYRAYYFPKVQAALGNETANTKTGSISFGTPTTNLTIFKPKFVRKGESGWRVRQIFDNEEDARAWVEEQLGVDTI